MTEKTFRAFLGILLPLNVQTMIDQDVISPLKKNWNDIKWTHTHQLHITLTFLGDISLEQAAAVTQSLKASAKQWPTFSVSLSKLIAFPSFVSPRIIGIDVQPHELFVPIMNEINLCLMQNQIPVESRPFVPHITIGRIKQKWIPPAHWERFAVIGSSLKIHEIILFKSELTPKGPIHEKFATIPFAYPTAQNGK